jgi:hypothetical protein
MEEALSASPTRLREIVPDHVAAELRTLGDRYGIRNIRVFGSFARGEGGPESDLDLLVEYVPGRGGERCFGRDAKGPSGSSLEQDKRDA